MEVKMCTAKKFNTKESSNKGIEKQKTRQIANKEQNGSSSFFCYFKCKWIKVSNLNRKRLKECI